MPDLPLVGYVDPRSLSSQFILETGKADLTDLVLRDVDDSRAVLQRVLAQRRAAWHRDPARRADVGRACRATCG